MGSLKKLVYNVHWFIIAYALWNLYLFYEEKDKELEDTKGRVGIIKGQVLRKQGELDKLLAYSERINAKKKELELATDEVAKLQKKFPNEINDPENLAIIKEIADGLNIKNPSLSSLREENKGFYFIRKYKFEAKATFLQFLILFEKISENDRLFNIHELSLVLTDEVQRGRFQLIQGEFIIEAYRYNANYKKSVTVSSKDIKSKDKRSRSKKKSKRRGKRR